MLVTCVACGWGVGTFAAGAAAAVGWIIASFIIAMPRPNGSVIITQSAAGEWYLYGARWLACSACSARLLPGSGALRRLAEAL